MKFIILSEFQQNEEDILEDLISNFGHDYGFQITLYTMSEYEQAKKLADKMNYVLNVVELNFLTKE